MRHIRIAIVGIIAADLLAFFLHCSGDFTVDTGGSEIKNPVTGTDGEETDPDSIVIIVVPRE